MNIKTKLSVGDKLFAIHKTDIWKIKDDRIEKPVTHSYGNPIRKIEIEVTKSGVDIKYYVNSDFSYFLESEDIFGSEEEAKKECDLRNQMILNSK